MSAATLDTAVHFLCKKSLKQLHEGILQEILSRTSTPGMPPLDSSFANVSSSGGYQYQHSIEKKCTLQQLAQVLNIYNYFPEEVDVKFLAT